MQANRRTLWTAIHNVIRRVIKISIAKNPSRNQLKVIMATKNWCDHCDLRIILWSSECAYLLIFAASNQQTPNMYHDMGYPFHGYTNYLTQFESNTYREPVPYMHHMSGVPMSQPPPQPVPPPPPPSYTDDPMHMAMMQSHDNRAWYQPPITPQPDLRYSFLFCISWSSTKKQMLCACKCIALIIQLHRLKIFHRAYSKWFWNNANIFFVAISRKGSCRESKGHATYARSWNSSCLLDKNIFKTYNFDFKTNFMSMNSCIILRREKLREIRTISNMVRLWHNRSDFSSMSFSFLFLK